MMKKISILLIVFNIFLSHLFTQAMTVDIDLAINLLHQNNLNIKEMALDVQIAERNKRSAWNMLIPPLNIKTYSTLMDNQIYTSSDSSKSIQEPYGPDEARFNFELKLNTGLNLNFAIGSRLKDLTLQYEVNELSYAMTVNELELKTKIIFYSLLNIEKQIIIKKQIIDLEESKYILLQADYQLGLITDLDLLESRVSFEKQKTAYSKLLNLNESLLQDFKMLLGIKKTQKIKLTGTLIIDTVSFNSDELIRKYLSKILFLKSLSKNLELMENQKKMKAQLAYTPLLSLGYSFTALTYNPWATDFRPVQGDPWVLERYGGIDKGNLTIQLSLSLDNFLPRSSINVEIRNMADQISQLSIFFQQSVQQSEIEIFNIISKLENSINQLRTYRRYEGLARQAEKMTNKEYETGTRVMLDVLSSQSELLSAQSKILDEEITYITNLYKLEYLLNTPTEKISQQRD